MPRILQRIPISGDRLHPVDVTNPAKYCYIFDDFSTSANLGGSGVGYQAWTQRISGTGATTNNGVPGVSNQANHNGWINLRTGTTTTGRAAITLFEGSDLRPGAGNNGTGDEYCEIGFLSSDLSDGTDSYFHLFGLHDVANATGEPTDGIYFRYSHDVNSGRWVCHTRAGGVETTLNSTATPALNVYQRLAFYVNGPHTMVEFYIDGAFVGTITTNIPDVAAEAYSLAMKTEKTAGTTDRRSILDYVYYWRKLSR